MPIADDDPRPTAAEARWFGVLLLAVFALLGSIVGWQLESARFTLAMLSVGAGLALLYSLIRPLRVPLFRSWMALVAPLGRLISTGVLGLVYFVLITPIGWGMKLAGRDALEQRVERDADSYWAPYDPGRDEDRYFRQS